MFKVISNKPDKQLKLTNDLAVQEITDCKFHNIQYYLIELSINN